MFSVQRDLPDVIIAVVVILGIAALCLVEPADTSIIIRTTDDESTVKHWVSADVLATTEGVRQNDDGSVCYRVYGDDPAAVRDAFQRGGCSATLVHPDTLETIASEHATADACVRVRRDGPLPVRVGIRKGVLIASFADPPPRSRYRETREFLKAFKDSLEGQQ